MPDTTAITVGRQELYDEIWSNSAAHVAKKYGIGYARFLSLCKANDIPLPPSGYWTKVGFGKPVEKTPLPGSAVTTVTLSDINDSQHADDAQTPAGSDISSSAIPDGVERIPLVTESLYKTPKSPYNRETLYKEIWEQPVTEVAKRYNVSDNAIRKVCKAMNIPLPEQGYWAKLRAGKPVKQTALPKIKTPKQELLIKTGTARILHIKNNALAFLLDEDREKILGVAAKLRVPGPTVQMQKKVADQYKKTKDWLESHKDGQPRQYGRGYIEEIPFMADTVSAASLSRAFRVVDALVKATMPYGGTMTYDFQFYVNGETVPFSVSESKDEIPHETTKAEKMELLKYEEEKRKHSWASKPKIPQYDRPWNGRLCITINGTLKFRDCKEYMLEDRIGEILVALYEASYPIRQARLAEEEKQQKEYEAQLRRRERAERYNAEIAKTEELVNAADDYDIACKIRAYVSAVESNGVPDDQAAAWIQWAREKADWYDPTTARKDEFFGVRDHKRAADRKKLKEDYSW